MGSNPAFSTAYRLGKLSRKNCCLTVSSESRRFFSQPSPTDPFEQKRPPNGDDFDAFFDARIQALSDLVEAAMGKPVIVEAGTNEVERDVETEDDEIVELEIAA